MKTIDEICAEYGFHLLTANIEAIRAIQLDAYRQGMTDAALIGDERARTRRNIAYCASETMAYSKAILDARDTKSL